MDEAALHELLSGRRRDVAARLLRGALGMASGGYAAVMALRNVAYDRHWLKVHHAAVPVISLGNITTGGTGKTPTAAWLANWLLEQGLRPGLLSRGYRAIEETKTPLGNPVGNDEKMVLDRLCAAVPHLQQRDRVSSARRLVTESGCNVLILDDGFQHRRLHRDLDLVLVDALQPWGFGRVLPRGLLREPRRGLRRAGLVVITRADQCLESDRQSLRNELRSLGTVDCVEIAFRPQRLAGLDGSQQSLDSLPGVKAIAFCGIGNPDGFRRTLSSLHVSADLRVFPDHHHYSHHDLLELADTARKNSAEIVLTTLKDLVKISLDTWTGPPLFAIEIGVEFLQGKELLIARLQSIVDQCLTLKG